MHDAVNLEKRGIPTVLIVTQPLTGNAENMARLRGIPDYPFVAVPHPVGPLDKNGVEALVRRAFPRILRLLLARSAADTQ